MSVSEQIVHSHTKFEKFPMNVGLCHVARRFDFRAEQDWNFARDDQCGTYAGAGASHVADGPLATSGYWASLGQNSSTQGCTNLPYCKTTMRSLSIVRPGGTMLGALTIVSMLSITSATIPSSYAQTSLPFNGTEKNSSALLTYANPVVSAPLSDLALGQQQVRRSCVALKTASTAHEHST